MYDNGELNCMMNEEKKGLKARLFGKSEANVQDMGKD